MPLIPKRSVLLLAGYLAVAGTAAAAQPQLRAAVDAGGVAVLENDAPVLYYQRTTTSLDGGWPRAGYVHPLYDLRGEVITEDFPRDHRHHRGVFWAWHQVWHGEKRLGDPWICRDFVWDVQSVEATSPASPLTLIARVHWKSPHHTDAAGRMIALVDEQTRITVHAAKHDHRAIDFEISLRALIPDLRIGGSEDVKGYGGFSPRIKLTGDEKFLSRLDVVQPTKTAIDAGPWINITGEDRGIVMISHRDNPSPNQRWILRQSRSMQNAAYPGRDPVDLSTDHPMHLRYRLAIHDGTLTGDDIDRLADRF